MKNNGKVTCITTVTGVSPDPDSPDVPTTNGEITLGTTEPYGHLTIEEVTTSTPSNGSTYALDETICYKATVVNDGNLTITNITVTCELTGDIWTIDSLAPGECEEFTHEYVVCENDILAGEVVVVTIANGTSPDPEEPNVPCDPGEDPEPTENPNGHLTVTTEATNTAGENGYELGEAICYKSTVLNDGNLTITNIKVRCELTGDEWTINSMAPGETKIFTHQYVVTEADILNREVEAKTKSSFRNLLKR